MKKALLIIAIFIGMEMGAVIVTIYINKIANEIRQH